MDVVTAARPRFLLATDRYEAFLKDFASIELLSKEDCAEEIGNITTACIGLGRAAQDFDFTLTHPTLRDTLASRVYGIELLEIITRPTIPNEVTEIYQDLYGADLQPYLEPGWQNPPEISSED